MVGLVLDFVGVLLFDLCVCCGGIVVVGVGLFVDVGIVGLVGVVVVCWWGFG